jgi:hypothetical protein
MHLIDPLHLSIALGPVAVYLLLLATVNLNSKPFITTGVRDALALAVAISGFVIAGPMELFLPESFAAVFGGWVWILLIGLYVLLVVLVVLLMRPRLVIYNISMDHLRPCLSQTTSELDAKTRWAGDSLIMPSLGVQLHIENHANMRNIQLLSVGNRQDMEGWRKLELKLRESLARITVNANPQGISFGMIAALIAALVVFALATGRQELAQALQEMLRM